METIDSKYIFGVFYSEIALLIQLLKTLRQQGHNKFIGIR